MMRLHWSDWSVDSCAQSFWSAPKSSSNDVADDDPPPTAAASPPFSWTAAGAAATSSATAEEVEEEAAAGAAGGSVVEGAGGSVGMVSVSVDPLFSSPMILTRLAPWDLKARSKLCA